MLLVLAQALAVVLDLIVVHAPGEHSEIAISVSQITAIHSTRKKNRELTDEAQCAISLSDGRYVTTVEDCEEIKKKIRELEHGRH